MTSAAGRRFLAGLAVAALWISCGGSGVSDSGVGGPRNRDWPQWGRTPFKNMTSDEKNLPMTLGPGTILPDGTIDPATTKNVLWVAKLGSQTYGYPTVSNGRVYVGTNNEGRGDPRFKGDYSVLRCIDAVTGKDVWSLTVPKLGGGKIHDWEFLGICSSPTIVDDRVYLLTNRCEVMALDVNGLADGNQGDQDEAEYMAYVRSTPGKPVELQPTDADIVWRFDLIKELGVFPHNITAGAVLAIGDILYCSTSNGVTYDHTDLPAPKAPALIALDRKAAERPGVTPREILVAEEASGISSRIFHGAWSSPGYGEAGGRGFILYGGPDGYCYAFDPNPLKDKDGFGLLPERWRYDCNPPDFRFRGDDKTKPIKYASLGEGPSEIIATPVFHRGRVYVGIGQDPEHRTRPGNLSCIDAASGTKVWDRRIHGTMSTCSIENNLLYIADLTGRLYCLDASNGALHWSFDTQAEVWGSTLVADGKVYLGNADGTLAIIATALMKKLADELGGAMEVNAKGRRLVLRQDNRTVREIPEEEAKNYFQRVNFDSGIHSTPIVAQGILYIATFRYLYAVKEERR